MSSASATLAVAKGDLVVRHESGSLIDKRFVVIRRLGAGGFGTVDLLRDRRSGAERVLKTVKIKGMKGEVVTQMKKEIMLLRELDHPRIVRMFEYAEDGQRGALHLVLEYLSGGSCDTLLKGGKVPSEDLVARLLQQVLSATAYCHARGIVHCDLKPENVILTSAVPAAAPAQCHCCCGGSQGGRCEEAVDCKVIDFGLAAHFVPSEPDAIAQFAGTPAFVAPEVVDVMNGGTFGPKADIWSIGVMAYNLLTSKLPFGHHCKDHGGDYWQVFNKIRAFRGVDFSAAEWQGCSEEACDFVEELMQRNAKKRPTAAEALQHGWLKDRHSTHHKRLRRSMLRSFRDFAKAPQLVKICLLLIASRSDGKSFRSCERAFMRLDVAGSGVITLEDLQEAVDNPGGYCPWCCYPRVNVEDMFRDINLSRSSSIEYSEFSAACLYAQLGSRSGRELARLAFEALDDDGDGLVTAQAARAFFSAKHREEFPMLSSLPQDRPINEKEFYKCLMRGQRPITRWLLSPFFCCTGTGGEKAGFDENYFNEFASEASSTTSSVSSEASRVNADRGDS